MMIKWVAQLGMNRRDPTHVQSVLSEAHRRSLSGGGGAGFPRAGVKARAPVRASTATSPPCVTYTLSRGKSQDGSCVTKTRPCVTSEGRING